MNESLNPIESQEVKHPLRELLKKFIAGDSHVHSSYSNISSHEADYSYKQIVDYVRDIVDKETGRAQFIILADHASDPGKPEVISGEDFLQQQEEINGFNNEHGSESCSYPKLVSGVEANVITSTGQIDVPDKIAEKIDFVIASIHALDLEPTADETGPRAPNAKELTEICYGLIDNPNVDVIGHINRNIPYQTLERMNWDDIFAKAAETRTAFEVNLRAPMPDWLIERAIKAGIPIFIGSDIHMLSQFQKLPEEIQSQIENPEDRLRYGPGTKYWRKMARVLKLLEKLDTPPEQVITSSYERLSAWLSKEKSERKIEIAKE